MSVSDALHLIDTDVVIVGGGVAGLATAIRCHALGLAVAVVDAPARHRPLLGETLPPETRSVFSELGFWELFETHFQSLPGRVAVWGHHQPTFTDHAFNAFGPAWLAEPEKLRPMMAGVAEDLGVRIFSRAAIKQSEPRFEGQRRLTIATEKKVISLTATFTVGATGRRWSALKTGTDRHLAEDAMIGLVSTIGAPNDSHYGLPLVEASEHGWWYSVKLRDGRYVVAYLTDTDLAKEGVTHAGSRRAFLNGRLAAAPQTAARTGGMISGEPTVVAASTYWSTAIAGDHSLSVGDAAWTVDPLSGLGLYSGCRAALGAAGAIYDHIAGKKPAIQEYALAQRREYDAMLTDRAAFYGLERRWPHSPFWHRRHRGHSQPIAAGSSA